MAENKKSFILYCDQKGVWDKLDDAQAGRLVKHIIAYVNDENPVAPDFVTELAFEPIKQSLKRDLRKWEKQQEQRVEAGKRSAEIRKRNATKANERSTTVSDRSISSTVNGSVNGSVSVNDILLEKETKERVFFQDEKLNDAFNKWLKMCKEVGKDYPESAIEAMQMKLNTSKQPLAMVKQSLEKGWKTLHPVESKPKGSNGITFASPII